MKKNKIFSVIIMIVFVLTVLMGIVYADEMNNDDSTISNVEDLNNDDIDDSIVPVEELAIETLTTEPVLEAEKVAEDVYYTTDTYDMLLTEQERMLTIGEDVPDSLKKKLELEKEYMESMQDDWARCKREQEERDLAIANGTFDPQMKEDTPPKPYMYTGIESIYNDTWMPQFFHVRARRQIQGSKICAPYDLLLSAMFNGTDGTLAKGTFIVHKEQKRDGSGMDTTETYYEGIANVTFTDLVSDDSIILFTYNDFGDDEVKEGYYDVEAWETVFSPYVQ